MCPDRYDIKNDVWTEVYGTTYKSYGTCGVVVDKREFWLMGGT